MSRRGTLLAGVFPKQERQLRPGQHNGLDAGVVRQPADDFDEPSAGLVPELARNQLTHVLRVDIVPILWRGRWTAMPRRANASG